MTWCTFPSVSLEMVEVVPGPEPSPLPGPFSQSQRLQPGARTSSKERLPPLSPTSTTDNDQAEAGIVQLR